MKPDALQTETLIMNDHTAIARDIDALDWSALTILLPEDIDAAARGSKLMAGWWW
jgi:hypothetical protein